MEEKKSPLNLVTALLLILLITIIGAVILITFTIKNSIDLAVSPVRNANQALSAYQDYFLTPPTVIPDPVTIIREVQSLDGWRPSSTRLKK